MTSRRMWEQAWIFPPFYNGEQQETIRNLKLNLYKAQNCEGIFQIVRAIVLDHKMFIS